MKIRDRSVTAHATQLSSSCRSCRPARKAVLPHFWCKARSTSPAAECGALIGSAATREQRRTIGDCREAGGSMPSRCVTTRRMRRATQRAARGERVAIRRCHDRRIDRRYARRPAAPKVRKNQIQCTDSASVHGLEVLRQLFMARPMGPQPSLPPREHPQILSALEMKAVRQLG